MNSYDITKYLIAGRNVVAIKATKSNSGPAGVAARVVVKSVGDTYIGFLTNERWRTSQKEFRQWSSAAFNDAQWLPAQVIGQFGVSRKPWLDGKCKPPREGDAGADFNVAHEFHVEPACRAKTCGNWLAADDGLQ